MTLSESAINEMLAVLNEGGGADLVRQLAQFGFQELIEAEATEAIGAAAWERSPEWVTHRNGHWGEYRFSRCSGCGFVGGVGRSGGGGCLVAEALMGSAVVVEHFDVVSKALLR